jgi:hypothetical protein
MTGNVTQEQEDKPPCKARRFIYINGVVKATYEGVLFGDGTVFLHFRRGVIPQFYSCLDALVSEMAESDRIEWIDQERKA